MFSWDNFDIITNIMLLAAGAIHHLNFLEIVRHPWFMSAFIAGGSAQFLKFLLSSLCVRKPLWRELLTSGGMPSGHSALVSALAFAIGFTEGCDAPYAMIAVGFGLIVLVDAVTLRREAGEHARLLNRIVQHLNNINEEDRLEAAKLEERIGHSRREMLAGVAFGAVVAFVVCAIWDFWK